MYSSQTLKLLVLFLFFIPGFAFAQTEPVSEAKTECKELLAKGTAAYLRGEDVEALEYFTKMETLAIKYQLKNELCYAKTNIGNIYSIFSNYGEALGYYKEALALAQSNTGLTEQVPSILSNIGLIYYTEKDYKTALEYYKQAYTTTKVASGDTRTVFAINLADLYNKTGDYTNAKKYLKEVEKLPKSDISQTAWKIKYAESLFLEGRINEAQMIVERMHGSIDANNVDCFILSTELLSKIYEKQHKTALAISYARQAVDKTYELTDRIEVYGQLTDLYTQKKDYETALKYKDSILISRDSLSRSINRGLFETNKVKLRIQEYQNELNINRQKFSGERNILILCICFSVVLFYFIYRNLKNRIAKQKQEKINADNEKKIYELELDNLKNNIAEKNRKLSAKALYLSGRNELIDDVITSLSAIPEVSNKKEVADYIKSLRAYIKSDAEWDDFITYFEQVNPVFIQTLNDKYPELNSSDIRFICYIYMNLDLREIANIFNITYNAAVKRHRRIKEKLAIETELPISDFLIQEFRNQ
jgi:tetratricopeptide (TPR) repeat protein